MFNSWLSIVFMFILAGVLIWLLVFLIKSQKKSFLKTLNDGTSQATTKTDTTPDTVINENGENITNTTDINIETQKRKLEPKRLKIVIISVILLVIFLVGIPLTIYLVDRSDDPEYLILGTWENPDARYTFSDDYTFTLVTGRGTVYMGEYGFGVYLIREKEIQEYNNPEYTSDGDPYVRTITLHYYNETDNLVSTEYRIHSISDTQMIIKKNAENTRLRSFSKIED